MIDVNTLDLETDSARYALALACVLERDEEVTLGPTDQELCARALRDRSALVDAGLA